jgi:hypothetical protein
MSESDYVEVYVPPEEMAEAARQLLDAAGDTPERVLTISGGFRVPADVASAAGLSPSEENAVDAETAGKTTGARSEEGGYADRIIAQEVEAGRATPQAVGAVFAQNAPNDSAVELDAARDEDDQDGPREAAEVRADATVEQQVAAAPPEQQEPRQEAPRQEARNEDEPGQHRAEERREDRDDAADLHGEELDEALERAGLSKSGRVAEKQERLREHRAGRDQK